LRHSTNSDGSSKPNRRTIRRPVTDGRSDMDSFPDIRSFTDEQLSAFLASLDEEAARGATDPALLSGSDPTRLDDPAVVYRRTVLSNKIEIVRAELSARRGPPEPD
jgi:hypothetical protein